MILFFVGLMCGLLIATIVLIGSHSFRTDVKKITNEVKKVLPQNKGGFIEPVEISEKIKQIFTK